MLASHLPRPYALWNSHCHRTATLFVQRGCGQCYGLHSWAGRKGEIDWNRLGKGQEQTTSSIEQRGTEIQIVTKSTSTPLQMVLGSSAGTWQICSKSILHLKRDVMQLSSTGHAHPRQWAHWCVASTALRQPQYIHLGFSRHSVGVLCFAAALPNVVQLPCGCAPKYSLVCALLLGQCSCVLPLMWPWLQVPIQIQVNQLC